MQSVIQRKSYGSVKVFWLDKELLKKRIQEAAKRLMSENSNVEKVVLFGSLVEDKATAFSDVDILILVKNSTRRYIDRPMDFVGHFQDIGLEVDLFVYTREEVEQKTKFIRAIQYKGECIMER
jgi:predicted nucleotidyltransferase